MQEAWDPLTGATRICLVHAAGEQEEGREVGRDGKLALLLSLGKKNINIYVYISALNERRRWMMKAQPRPGNKP